MNTPQHRYRITVTPIEADGLPCQRRCAIEFEHRDRTDWMRMLESIQRRLGLSGDERAALAVALRLLDTLSHREGDELFAALRPHLDAFIQDLHATH